MNKKLTMLVKKLSIEEQKLQVEIKRKYGAEVNLWANASLEAIFEQEQDMVS
jgi:hypothetical protein